MCKYDEAFTEKEMLEETGFCKDCKMDCQNAGKTNEVNQRNFLRNLFILTCRH